MAESGRLRMAAAAVAGVTALDLLCAERLSRRGGENGASSNRIQIDEAVTIRAGIERVETGWTEWRMLNQSQLDACSSARIVPAPGARGTEVHVRVEYDAGSGLGRMLEKAFDAAPEQIVREDLRRFKQLMEAGEVTVSDGPGLKRPARPARDVERLKTLAGVRR
jgi:uncharacterized membrane protein